VADRGRVPRGSHLAEKQALERLPNPITVVDQVIGEYKSYLSTEFQARDPQLRAALEAALTEAGFLAQHRSGRRSG
jgi:hypothetical protein